MITGAAALLCVSVPLTHQQGAVAADPISVLHGHCPAQVSARCNICSGRRCTAALLRVDIGMFHTHHQQGGPVAEPASRCCACNSCSIRQCTPPDDDPVSVLPGLCVQTLPSSEQRHTLGIVVAVAAATLQLLRLLLLLWLLLLLLLLSPSS